MATAGRTDAGRNRRRKGINVLLWGALAVASVSGGVFMPRDAALLKTDYLVNYLGVFLGLMVATITFLHGVCDKLFDKLVADYQQCRDLDAGKATRLKSIIRDIESLFKGLKLVTLWLFSSLIVVLAIGLLEAFNPPQYIVSWTLPWSFSVQQSFTSVKCAAFFFSLLVMLMVILNLFQVISASAQARAEVLEEPPPTGS